MIDETPADRLRDAASYVRDHHTRGGLLDAQGNVCAVGAVLKLGQSGDLPGECKRIGMRPAEVELRRDPIAQAAVKILCGHLVSEAGQPADRRWELLHVSVLMVEHWNDHEARDGAEVAAVMEKAAARWEERGGRA
jgi:hypothetical protein